MRKISEIVLILILCWACKRQNTDPMIVSEISKINNFEIELPYGNEFYSDSISSPKNIFHFYDETGAVLPIDINKFGDKLSITANGISIKNTIDFSFKTKIPNIYNISFGINGMQKDIILKAVPKNGLGSKNSEFQLYFRVINDDFPQEYFENTINFLNEIYAVQNKMNIKFKLAEFDENGNKLIRKGAFLIKDVTFSADNSTSFSITKYGADKPNTINIYALNKDNNTNWSGIWNGANFQINTLIFSNKKLGDGRINPAFTVMAHEIGHYFGLKHIYRNDNNCQVQEGVNDIEAYNNVNGSQTVSLQNQGNYISNCGNIWKRENIMDGGVSKITNDQKNVIYMSKNFK